MGCLFCDIVEGKQKTSIVYEDANMVCFHDLYPAAPTHILLIPKEHITTLDDAKTEHQMLLGSLILKATALAKEAELLNGYRLVFNVNKAGGQAIYHIHLHLLGGRQMTWPPG